MRDGCVMFRTENQPDRGVFVGIGLVLASIIQVEIEPRLNHLTDDVCFSRNMSAVDRRSSKCTGSYRRAIRFSSPNVWSQADLPSQRVPEIDTGFKPEKARLTPPAPSAECVVPRQRVRHFRCVGAEMILQRPFACILTAREREMSTKAIVGVVCGVLVIFLLEGFAVVAWS